ncbi:MAG: hypothetical protein O7E52_14900 [Candidatus Poribacteria bacterium]|nr:hypothetical protein [Candidatus Poribacteria bacterium]
MKSLDPSLIEYVERMLSDCVGGVVRLNVAEQIDGNFVVLRCQLAEAPCGSPKHVAGR